MKADTLKRLGLKADASDDAVETAVAGLLDQAAEARAVTEQETAVNKLITESGGALTRKTALAVIANRDGYKRDQEKKEDKAKKKK